MLPFHRALPSFHTSHTSNQPSHALSVCATCGKCVLAHLYGQRRHAARSVWEPTLSSCIWTFGAGVHVYAVVRDRYL
ncbi:hypothetical protein K438DRAFT_1872525 [Mycena galopus ATCC 62051]|nr:hypothetical protein K438DRAFT_1872525 [Mycena galopus ATCC 62051]